MNTRIIREGSDLYFEETPAAAQILCGIEVYANKSDGFYFPEAEPLLLAPEFKTSTMNRSAEMSTTFLRVKIRSLAMEARIIRHEENKCCPKRRAVFNPVPTEHQKHHEWSVDGYVHTRYEKVKHGAEPRDEYWPLRWHRIGDVRNEQRSALLAYGFLRGRTYARIESYSLVPPSFNRVVELVVKFGGDRIIKFAEQYQIPIAGKADKLSAIAAPLIQKWLEGSQWPVKIDSNNRLWCPEAGITMERIQRERAERRSERLHRRFVKTCEGSSR